MGWVTEISSKQSISRLLKWDIFMPDQRSTNSVKSLNDELQKL